jgi:predicted nicotinamide N-methyase
MHRRLLDNLRKTVSQGSLEITPLPQCPEIELYLLSADYPRGRLPDEEMLAILNSPAYWAFCWASGQALANYIVSNRHLFEGKTVLDFGSGSGVVAIAAAKAGAKTVYACDIDAMAIDAIATNALLNQVDILTCREISELRTKPDLIIAADVLYDRDNHHYIAEFLELAGQVLLADSRMTTTDIPGYDVIAEFNSRTLPDLQEFEQYNLVRIYTDKIALGPNSLPNPA